MTVLVLHRGRRRRAHLKHEDKYDYLSVNRVYATCVCYLYYSRYPRFMHSRHVRSFAQFDLICAGMAAGLCVLYCFTFVLLANGELYHIDLDGNHHKYMHTIYSYIVCSQLICMRNTLCAPCSHMWCWWCWHNFAL